MPYRERAGDRVSVVRRAEIDNQTERKVEAVRIAR
jgi:hypothetical protein